MNIADLCLKLQIQRTKKILWREAVRKVIDKFKKKVLVTVVTLAFIANILGMLFENEMR